MAEIERDRNDDRNSLDLDLPESEFATDKPEDLYLDVYDERGNKQKLRVIFSVVDKKNSASYIFVEQGEDEVLALATKIDENGNPLQDELEVVGEGSPYLSAVEEFLKAYNEGDLTHGRETDDAEQA